MQKYVSSAHGGSMYVKCIYDMTKHAFLIEEQKITVKVLEA